jgi:hypothetical protein
MKVGVNSSGEQKCKEKITDLSVIKHYALKTYGRVHLQLHALTSVLNGGE